MTYLNLNSIDIEKLLKSYNNIKKCQKKYSQSDKGKEKINEASRRYYNKKREDPEFMEKQKLRTHNRRFNKINNIEKLENFEIKIVYYFFFLQFFKY